ncbi:hypothetical protein ASG43_17355 [Aureimonas sp. Leaf454]|uniref:hypothetical protein n=1 Tax=Aureimonas sp. Leaf454 TaxID=1736381 RepID=UPI0006F71B6D|nr:hypothetical protein [Aureimonas sp. Leaf454]KQT42042.1 hypothetical protein ASG43_17355 [Aureimonas sp. Leaf454]
MRFPIDGGLLGNRLMLIDGKRQPEFDKVTNAEDPKAFVAIQGRGWGDIETLRHGGVTVRTGPYKSLFRMTVGGRADFFPRGAFEALHEREDHVGEVPDLAVETSLVVQYPLALLFYVARDKAGLQDDIERGLKAAWADGSYERMFRSDPNIKLALEKGDLSTRRLIALDNPSFSAELITLGKDYLYKR